MAEQTTEQKAKKMDRPAPPRRAVERLPRAERDVERFPSLLDRMLEDFWRRPLPGLLAPERWWPARRLTLELPALDVYEEDDQVVVKAEVPGVSKQDVEVNVTGDTLTIKTEKKQQEEVKEKDYWYKERSYGSFERTIELPSEVKTDQVKASFKDGVLEIRLPKTEEAKKKAVTVKID